MFTSINTVTLSDGYIRYNPTPGIVLDLSGIELDPVYIQQQSQLDPV